MNNFSDMTTNAHPTIAVFIEPRRERIQMRSYARQA